jgi:uncharacterized protein (DUF1015 family)
MPAMSAADRATGVTGRGAPRQRAPEGADRQPAGLVVAPFRGLRYDPARVSDLAAVTSPPYDVIDADGAAHLEALDPHNVVRLILPRDVPGSASRYAQARAALESWLADGILRRDPEPALYVYEQAGADVLQRGLLAAVAVRDPEDGIVLPHEDVMPGPVADRLDLMRATSANLEPILLVYEGGGETAAVIDEVCAGEPDLVTTAEDGLRQRMWVVTDPRMHARVRDDLRGRQALIADGHHRYATYRRLRDEQRASGQDVGDWDLGLAMLVDSRRHPLTVRAIHRVVAGLDFDTAIGKLEPVLTVTPLHGAGLDDWLAALDEAPGRNAFVVTDGRVAAVVGDPDPTAVAAALPADEHTLSWRELDASVLHALVLRRLWQVDDDGSAVSYLHDAAGAVRAAARGAGVAVLMRPVSVDVVRTLAARGERMPRKSTSFGPKPRTGLVLRPVGEALPTD